LVHVTATDPPRAGCHPNLIAHAIVAYRSPNSVSAVPVVVAGERRIVAARVADAVVYGVVPVVIVISVLSVPATVVRLQRVMGPALAGIGASYRNPLALKPSAHTSGACVY
jgi:hypothetical protein